LSYEIFDNNRSTPITPNNKVQIRNFDDFLVNWIQLGPSIHEGFSHSNPECCDQCKVCYVQTIYVQIDQCSPIKHTSNAITNKTNAFNQCSPVRPFGDVLSIYSRFDQCSPIKQTINAIINMGPIYSTNVLWSITSILLIYQFLFHLTEVLESAPAKIILYKCYSGRTSYYFNRQLLVMD